MWLRLVGPGHHGIGTVLRIVGTPGEPQGRASVVRVATWAECPCPAHVRPPEGLCFPLEDNVPYVASLLVRTLRQKRAKRGKSLNPQTDSSPRGWGAERAGIASLAQFYYPTQGFDSGRRAAPQNVWRSSAPEPLHIHYPDRKPPPCQQEHQPCGPC